MPRGVILYIKSILKRKIHDLGLDNNPCYSRLYVFYLRLISSPFFQPQRRHLQIYKSLIRKIKNPLVFDIGASFGIETAVFLKLGARVIAIEPDRTCLQVLKMRFGNNKNVTIVDSAVSDKEGPGKLFVTAGGSGFNTLSSKWKESLGNPKINRFSYKMQFDSTCDIQTVTLNALFRKFGAPDYIKIDVEGYEYNVISGLSQPVPALSFEVNMPEFTEEAVNSLRHLHNLSSQYRFNYSISDKLELQEFVSYDELLDFFRKTKIRAMDIYACRPC
jgi:FkbM family methyltransferase